MRSENPCWRRDAATWKPAWPAPTIKTDFCVINSNRYDAKRQAVKAAQGVVQSPLRFAGQFKRRNVPQKRTQYRLGLQPRHGLPDATMNAGAKGHVSGRAAAHVEGVGLLPPAR